MKSMSYGEYNPLSGSVGYLEERIEETN